MFVTKEEIPVTLDNVNFIFIKSKLNYGERMRVQKAALQVKGSAATAIAAEWDTAAYQQALLTENIVRWVGPEFVGRECTIANILELDPDEPLLDKVITEIATRNKDKAVGPKSPAGDAPLTVTPS